MRPSLAASPLVAALLGALLTAPLHAQVVTGRVTDSTAGTPTAGAIVTLVTPDGRRLGAVLTEADGAYRVTAPAPGSYHLRVDLIGYRSWQSPVLALHEGETVAFDVRLPLRRVRLDAVVVTGASRCTQNPQDAPRMLATWEEIRRALTGSVLSERDHRLPFELRLTQRLMTGRGEVAGSRRTARLRGSALRPWDAPAPQELAERGYVRQEGDSLRWFGPSVETLLSDPFLATHCFRAVRDGGRVGLAFTPLPDRTLPDIAGTIWLDARSSELRTVEFTFQHTADSLGNGEPPDGRLEFARLPSGLWHISRWRLRVPLTALSLGDPDDPNVAWERRRQRRIRSRIDEPFREGSGEAVLLTAEGEADGRPPAVVAGVVTDSTTGEPLADVQVLVPGAEPIVTDSAGRYALEIGDAPEAVTAYAVTFVHPRFALLGLQRTEGLAMVRAGDTVAVDFAVPSVATLLRAACPLNDEAPTDGSGRLRLGMLLGEVTMADGGLPPAGTEVAAEWVSEDAVADPVTGGQVTQLRSARVRPDGGFHLCPLPIGREVTLQARREGRMLATTRLVVPGSGLARYTLVLEPGGAR